ncbi:cadmium-translocating P-type ATPase [Rhodopseudomonas palustris]|uniref:heavy metal translocating P-type ATPase n=1 Tax=Rhodopseudomonas palustris TaxID=1076 RepID=UPI0021F34A6F|nr:heavy metal translocating P-type ATPase [Rhodopseudomonas palustris]UYO43015.1 cadmium-translocating P-type ATPase [Rhodopseudomonas palustris]
MATEAYKIRVEGMDCASCALKIETAMQRLPGVADVRVSYSAATLALRFDQDRISPSTIDDELRSLGYRPQAIARSLSSIRAERKRLPWWQDAKLQTVMIAAAVFALAFALAQLFPAYARWLYSAAAAVCLIPIARRALIGARSGSPFSIETLMTVAAIGAVVIGEAEEAAVVIVLFNVGEWLETFAAGRARAGIAALTDVVPRTARRLRDGSDQVEEIPAADLMIGDVVVVRPGDRIPSDGKVLDGHSDVNEAPITGESVPVAKAVGDHVYAGSINANGELRIETTNAAADNTIARIIHLVEQAQESKAPTERMIDRLSRWYTPAAMLVALLVIIVPPLGFGEDWATWIYRGLATLLIACPCALVISTPAAIASGLAVGARKGLLIKGGAVLETLGKVKTVAFDKTGTLTLGQPQVTDVVAVIGQQDDAVLARAAAVEGNTSHPIGQAIVRAAKARALQLPVVFGGSQAVPGKAISARLKDGFAFVGSPRFAAERTTIPPELATTISGLEREGKTVVVLISGNTCEGAIAVRDEPRPDAAGALRQLTSKGIAVVMLTGDNARTAQAIAGQLGMEARAELLPDAKLAEISRLKEVSPVAMVGDGINDAPALAAASVGIAMGGGTDVALETADAALLNDRAHGVAELIALSQATLGNIWQNISIALGLKAVFLATSLLGVTTLWMAILADTGATVLVTANALRLLRWRASEA